MRDNRIELQSGGGHLPYSVAGLYVHRGWQGVLPLPPKQKAPPPDGYTGASGRWPGTEVIQGWIGSRPESNIGLRLPDNVVGIDVDAYGDKHGDRTIDDCEERWGPLPPTWVSTSRDSGPSGIRLYRLPSGCSTDHWPSQVGADVEVIRAGHRYAVVAPSSHPEGRLYRWITPEGQVSELPPSVEDLAELPLLWVEGMTRSRTAPDAPGRLATRIRRMEARAWIETLPRGPMCPRMAALSAEAEECATRIHGSAHDNTLASVGSMIRSADRGHVGVQEALAALRQSFVTTTSDRQPVERAMAEFDHIVADAAASVMAHAE